MSKPTRRPPEATPRPDPEQDRTDADRAQPRGHRGSRPLGNPEVEKQDLERGRENLERVLGR